MKKAWKITAGLVLLPVVGVSGLGAIGQARWDRTFDVPEPELRASADAELIARGRYLAYGPAHCASCHTLQDAWPAIEAGEEPPMSGGNEFKLPFGTFRAPNITPDSLTGIGRLTDGQLARMLRSGVRHDGRAALPFMEFQNLSDEDVVAILSFLRSQAPVDNAVPPHQLNGLGKVVFSFLIAPKGPASGPPARPPAEAPTVERGEYLANAVANCAGCHSQRSHLDGSYTGARLAGGAVMPVEGNPDMVFVTPNLTPDPATGHIFGWSEERFIARFRAGTLHEGTHMPWGPYARMSDTDLRALYVYLNSVDPVTNATGPLLRPARE
jgi:mono/diheme cytochrome c family protein